MAELLAWQLEAAEDVLQQWEAVLQRWIAAARSDGHPDEVQRLQEQLYASARERKALARAVPDDVQKTAERYAAMLRSQHSAS